MVSWFKQQFGHPEVAAALTEGVTPEALFDRLVGERAAGQPRSDAATLLDAGHSRTRVRTRAAR